MAETPEDDVAIVNLEELAELMGSTMVTLRARMREHPDFPILKRGDNGKAYQFDARAVADFLAGLAAADEAKVDARNQELAAMRLELFPGTDADDETLTLSPAQRRQEIEAVRLADIVAERRGQLTPTDQVANAVRDALAALRSKLLAMPDDIARDLDLDRETRLALRDRVDGALADLAATLRAEETYDVTRAA
jgi:hypothetical protein